MDAVEAVRVEPLTTSQFVRPFRMRYSQDKVEKLWDLVSLHDSVCIIIFNTDRQKLILVKQFRPAVYYSGIPKEERKHAGGHVDTARHPGKSGITLELCAGIVDKNGSLAEVAKDEVLEECGYEVPLEAFQFVKSYRAGVGVSGDRQTMFYVEVTDKMKVSEGGGVAVEGEMIEVVEMGVEEVKTFLSSPEVTAPAGLLYAFQWFLQHKAPSTSTSTNTP